MRAQNDSTTALSSGSPTVPSEGRRPAFRAREVRAHEVKCVPWSPWMMVPGAGRRESITIPSAFVASSARCVVSIAHPTTRRLNTSSTTQSQTIGIPIEASSELRSVLTSSHANRSLAPDGEVTRHRLVKERAACLAGALEPCEPGRDRRVRCRAARGNSSSRRCAARRLRRVGLWRIRASRSGWRR